MVIKDSISFISSKEKKMFELYGENNSYANMIRSGSKGKINHMTSL